MKIKYQNNHTGAAFDVSSLVTQASWTTQRTGSPAKLELTVLDDTSVEWTEGGIVAAMDEEQGFFYGYVFTISRSEEETVSITAYDQMRYLKNKATYEFEGKRADQILSQLAADFKLEVGELPNTGYVIPYMLQDGKMLFDMILEALDRTLIYGGRMFYLWDDYGKLRLSEVKPPQQIPVVGTGKLATGYTYERSIDGETYNRIVLYQDNKNSGKRDTYIAEDSNNKLFWGTLQAYEKAEDGSNEAQIQERCMTMLEFYNRPQRTLSLSALAIKGLRAGQIIGIDLPAVGPEQTYLVEEASHDWMAGTMELKVKVV